MSVEKERCPYELYVEQYFGLPETVNEKHEIKTDFGMLVNLLSGFDQKLKAASSKEVESEEKRLLNLAQAEIRAMYKRVGIIGSNILSLIDNYLEQTKEVSTNNQK